MSYSVTNIIALIIMLLSRVKKNIKMSIEGDTQFEIIALYILSNLVTIIDFFSYTNRLQTNYATNFYQFLFSLTSCRYPC